MIRLVNVDSRYIRYLYNHDNRVMFNKGQHRPYIGIMFEVRGHKYYAPLTHPKPKFLNMRNAVDFMRIDGGKLGAINFNNMIPIVDGVLEFIKVSEIEDEKYKLLLINQEDFFADNETEIINRATKLYKAYRSKKLRSEVVVRCCNFYKLEAVAKKYDPNFKHDPSKVKKH